MSRIVMAMSGGVDSSVAAALLRREGHDVIGVFMRHGEREPASCATAPSTSPLHPFTSSPLQTEKGGRWKVEGGTSALIATLPIVQPRPDHKQGCCSATDAEDARRIAQQFDIPFYALNLSEDFARIIDYFVDEYTAARTPNPCVLCNNWLKFGKLFDYADSVGAEFVATGHYARILPFSRVACDALETELPSLHRGLDATKDQSYVLFGVAKKYLPRMMFPVGNFHKHEIRTLAHELGLRVADKPDSQEICFVAKGDHAEFVRRRRSQRGDSGGGVEQLDLDDAIDTAGEIVLTDGTVVGTHPGIEGFTIGQRKGLRVAMGEPYFVTHIEAATNRVVIGRREELARTELAADRANWLVDPPREPFRAAVQIRYNSTASSALVKPLENGRFHVEFDEPQYGVAPGQAAVCYDDSRVLGGGWIE